MKRAIELLYRLFFDKEDGLDLSQFYLLSLNIVFIIWIVSIGLKTWTLSEPMLDAFLIIYSTTVLLSSPTWLVKIWLQNKDWFRRQAIANTQQIVEQTVGGTTDVSEMNIPGALPVVPPTAFPMAPDSAPTSPINSSFKG